jgi:hypothetical protein
MSVSCSTVSPVTVRCAPAGHRHGERQHTVEHVEHLEAAADAVTPEIELRILFRQWPLDGHTARVGEREHSPLVESGVTRRSLPRFILHLLLQYFAEIGTAEFEIADDPVVAERLGFKIAAHGVEAAGAELLARHQRAVRELSLNLAVDLETLGQFLGMRNIEIEVREARRGGEALVVELFSQAAERTKVVGQPGVELGREILGLERRAVGRDNRIVGHGRTERAGAKRDRLVEMLVVDADRQSVEEVFPGRQCHHRPAADDLARADDAGAADGGDITARLHAIDHQAEPVDLRKTRQVGGRIHFGIARPLRGDLIGEAEGMPELPQIVVMHSGTDAGRRGVWRLPVVHLDAGVDRRLVLDVEVDVHRAGRGAGAQCRGHPPIGPLIERDDVLGDLAETRHRAFLERRRTLLDFFQVEIARALHPQPTDLQLGDLQNDNFKSHILLRYGDADRLITFVVIGLLQRGACLLDILGALVRTQERIDGLFDIDLRKLVGALDGKIVDVETRNGGGGLLRRG